MSVPITAEHEQPARPDSKQVFTLTANDHCDGCGARAYVRCFVTGYKSEILLCGHHANKHEEALMPISLVWQDEREAILL